MVGLCLNTHSVGDDMTYQRKVCPMPESDKEKFSMMFDLGVVPQRCAGLVECYRCALPDGRSGDCFTSRECGIISDGVMMPFGCIHKTRGGAADYCAIDTTWCY